MEDAVPPALSVRMKYHRSQVMSVVRRERGIRGRGGLSDVWVSSYQRTIIELKILLLFFSDLIRMIVLREQRLNYSSKL